MAAGICFPSPTSVHQSYHLSRPWHVKQIWRVPSLSGGQRIALLHVVYGVITTSQIPFDTRNSSNGTNTCYSPAFALPIPFNLLHVDCLYSRSRVEGSNAMPPHIKRVIALHCSYPYTHTVICLFLPLSEERVPLHPRKHEYVRFWGSF